MTRRGVLERPLTPPVTRHIFRKELRLLADYAAGQRVWEAELLVAGWPEEHARQTLSLPPG